MKNDSIKQFSLERLRAKVDVQGVDDDLLIFRDLATLPIPQEPRRMNCLIIGVCTKGEMEYTLNEKVFKGKAGDAVILSEGQVLDGLKFSEDCEGVALLLSYTFLYEIVKDIQHLSTLFLLARRRPLFPLNQEEITTVYEYLGLIEKRISQGDRQFRKDVIRLLLVTMIYDLGSAFYRILHSSDNEGHSVRAEQIFVQYLQLVEHNFIEQRRVSWYAEQMGITAKYLSETVSGISHHTPNDWIERYVTTEIRNQLCKTTKKISQIAKDMNFPNQSFMGKYFKENVGVSPIQYRKMGGQIDKKK